MAKTKKIVIGDDYQLACDEFLKIAEKTGILTREVIVEPNASERDTLWEITCAIKKRIYKLDIDANADKDEINVLCHYAIVALHWCDILMQDERFSFDNGRFRRDTIALAACLFTRVSRVYQYYDILYFGWIRPHLNFSILLWTINSIVNCNKDNIFHKFSPAEAKKASAHFQELSMEQIGFVHTKDLKDSSPLKKIWLEIYNRFSSSQVPYEFLLNYIWMSADLPGGMGLLSEDREMNKAYFKKQIIHKQFPNEWIFINDIFYIGLYLATKSNNKLLVVDKKKIIELTKEWVKNSFNTQKELDRFIDAQFQISEKCYKEDADEIRFYSAIESLYRTLMTHYQGNLEKVNSQCTNFLKDLVKIANANDEINQEEINIIENIKTYLSIDVKLFDEMKLDKKVKKVAKKAVPKAKPTKSESPYYDNYPGNFYCQNELWWNQGIPLSIMNFPNIIENKEDEAKIFRRFTQKEVDQIVKKIKATGDLIYLNFIRTMMERKFDLRGMKSPFWFIPFTAYGWNFGGIMYFEQNGIYTNVENPTTIKNTVHVDKWDIVSCEKGYNGLEYDYDFEETDENILTSLKIEFTHNGEDGVINVVETHGDQYASTLPIVMAIWENAWSDVVERSKETSGFQLGPPPMMQVFESWEELIEWSETK